MLCIGVLSMLNLLSSPLRKFNSGFTSLPIFQLSKDWFPPAEASSKRTHIKRLIHKIVEDNSQKVPRSACDKYSSESEEADGEDPGLELLREIRNSYNESCSDSNADQGINVTPMAVVPLKSLQYLKKSKLVCDSLLDPGDNAASLTDWDCRTSGQIVPLNCFKNVVSPIEVINFCHCTGEEFFFFFLFFL